MRVRACAASACLDKHPIIQSAYYLLTVERFMHGMPMPGLDKRVAAFQFETHLHSASKAILTSDPNAARQAFLAALENHVVFGFGDLKVDSTTRAALADRPFDEQRARGLIHAFPQSQWPYAVAMVVDSSTDCRHSLLDDLANILARSDIALRGIQAPNLMDQEVLYIVQYLRHR